MPVRDEIQLCLKVEGDSRCLTVFVFLALWLAAS